MLRKKEKKGGRQARLEGIANKPGSQKNRARQGYKAGVKPQVEIQHATGLLGSLSAGVCIFDKYGAITFCNGRFAELAGQTVRKLLGRKLRKNTLWGSAGQQDEFRELFIKAKESRQVLAIRSVPVNKAGTRYWDLEFRPYISRKKKYEGMGLLVEDVTQARRQENARELLNRYYAAALLQTSPQALLEESVRLLCEFSGCPSVQILLLDRCTGGVMKHASEQSPGLWDSGHTVTQAFIQSLFSRPENGVDLYRKDNGSVYLADVGALESELGGNLKELVAGACNSYGFKSLALIPVTLEGRETGYIQLASPHVYGITEETVEAVERIAGHLQVIWEHAGLKDELRRQRQGLLKQIYERSAHLESLGERLKQEVTERKNAQEEMRVQRDLAISLNGIESMDAALNLCLDTAITVSGMDSGGIYLADPVAGGFKLVCARGLSEDFVKLVSYHSATEPGGKLVMGDKSLFGKYRELGAALDEMHGKEGLKGIGSVPIIHGGKTVACLSIASHVFEEIPVNARNAVEAISAVLGTFIAHISGREELIESEERYRTLFARTTNPIMVIDGEGNYIDGNDAALAFLEFNREEFLAMNVRDTLPPYLDDEWFERLRKVWETGGTVERDYYVWGKIKVLELTIIPLQVTGRKLVFGIGKDITERKIAEAALRESEEKYRSLIENAGEAIFIVQDAKIKFANKLSLELVQYSSEELTSRPFSEFIDTRDRQMVMERHAARLRGENVEPFYPFRVVDKDGSVKWLEMRAIPVQWENKPATLALMTDISGRECCVVDRD
jgi:PAS domain S-box-containing protein